VKYKQSIMGFFWAILMPMLIVLAGLLVKIAMGRLSGTPAQMTDFTAVAVKAVPWSFFISSVRFGTNSLTSNVNLVTKIYFPKEIFPISAVISNFFDFLIASATVSIVLAVVGIGWSAYLLWVPVLILILVFFSIALGIFLAAGNLFFRDVKYLVEVFVTFAIFVTPVFYEVELAGKWYWILLMNPVAPLLEGMRSVVIMHEAPRYTWILYSASVSVLGYLGAMKMFKRLEPKFAESI
jgi:lipopolysaccharide transport system permease protein